MLRNMEYNKIKEKILDRWNLTIEEGKYTLHNKYKFTCKSCGFTFIKALRFDRNFSCPNCHPIEHGSSKGERELYDILASTGLHVVNNNRTILKGKELDIYFPDLKFAIEYDGKYWHDKEKDSIKEELCKQKGIKLIRVSDEEFNNDKNTIVNRILEILKNDYNLNVKIGEVKEIIRVSEKCRKIICTDTQEIFDNYLQLSSIHPDYNIRDVLNVCNGILKNYKGYHFQYYEEEKDYPITERKYEYKCKRILCVETNEVFPSLNYLIRIGMKTVEGVLYGKQKTCRNLHWKWTELPPTDTKYTETLLHSNSTSKTKQIYCIETNELFPSVDSIRGNFSRAAVINAIKSNKPFQGKHYTYTGVLVGEFKKDCKKIVCINTGEVFDSLEQASTHFNIYKEGIAKCCRGEINSTHNLQFEYLNDKRQKKVRQKNKKVCCTTTNETFNSLKDASAHFNIDKRTIVKLCNNKKEYKGLCFTFIE